MSNYVKFMRGTPRAYERLVEKNDDTLYFIAEKDALSGKLYLGDKELVCSNNSATVQYLKDLIDVNLPADIGELIDGQVLTYDVATESWVARDPVATAQVRFDSNQFVLSDNGELSIVNFANAPAGSQLTKTADGSLVWLLPDETTVEGLSEALDLVQADVATLTNKFNDYDTAEEVDTKIATALAGANHLSYKIVNSTTEIDLAAGDADRYIYLVKVDGSYDEYMVVNGALERVGDWDVSLDNYATKEELNAVDTKVVDLTQLVNSNAAAIGTINTTVEDLTAQLNPLKETVNSHTAAIADLTSALANKVDVSVYNEKMVLIDEDLSELQAALTWSNLSEE